MRVLVVGDIAVRGTKRLLEECGAELEKAFSNSFMRRVRSLEEAKIPRFEYGIRHIEIGEGGFNKALWDLAEREKTGLRIQLDAVPVRQETIEVCNNLDIDPYELASGGAICFVPEHLHIDGTDIGYTVNDKKRLLLYGDTQRFLRVNRTEQTGE